MKKIKLEVDRKSVVEKIAEGKAVGEKMEADANPDIQNSGKTVSGTSKKLSDINTERTIAQDAATAKTVALNTQEVLWDDDYRAAASKAEEIYPKNPEKWKELGFKVTSDPTPVGAMPQVQNLALTSGDHEGTLDVSWDSVRGAKSYVMQFSPDPFTETSWKSLTPVTKSKATVAIKEEGVPLGAKVWLRVAAVGAAGQGPWSDPAVKVVA